MEKSYGNRPGFIAQIGRLRLRQLEILIVIAEQMTLTGAADVLGTTQPTVSQVLVDVESAVGVSLFKRGRRLTPTEFLDPVLRYARRATKDAGQLADDIRMASRGWAGRVRVGSMMVGTAAAIPQAIALLRAEGSEIEIEVHEDIAAGLWPRLERDEIDLLVGRIHSREPSPRIRTEMLFDDHPVVVTSPRHPLAQQPLVSLSEAVRYPWVLPPRGTQFRKSIEEDFAEAGLAPPVCWQESGSVTLNLATIASTDCLFVNSAASTKLYGDAGMLAVLPIRLKRDVGPVGMAWRDHEIAKPLQEFQAALRAVAGKGESDQGSIRGALDRTR